VEVIENIVHSLYRQNIESNQGDVQQSPGTSYEDSPGQAWVNLNLVNTNCTFENENTRKDAVDT